MGQKVTPLLTTKCRFAETEIPDWRGDDRVHGIVEERSRKHHASVGMKCLKFGMMGRRHVAQYGTLVVELRRATMECQFSAPGKANAVQEVCEKNGILNRPETKADMHHRRTREEECSKNIQLANTLG